MVITIKSFCNIGVVIFMASRRECKLERLEASSLASESGVVTFDVTCSSQLSFPTAVTSILYQVYHTMNESICYVFIIIRSLLLNGWCKAVISRLRNACIIFQSNVTTFATGRSWTHAASFSHAYLSSRIYL